MKQIFLILIAFVVCTSCGKDNSWSPEEDVKDFLESHPYGVIFDNSTNGDLYITCDEISKNVIIVKEGDNSNVYHSSKSHITITYSGEGSYWTQKTKGIDLVKDEIIHYTITYP